MIHFVLLEQHFLVHTLTDMVASSAVGALVAMDLANAMVLRLG